MKRRLIIAAVACGLFLPSQVWGQHSAPSRGLLDRFMNGDSNDSEAPPQQNARYANAQNVDARYVEDRQVRPAAAQSTGRPQAAREQSMNRTSRSSKQTLMGRLKLPNLIPQSLRGGNQQQQEQFEGNSEPPMPYDMSEVTEPQASRPASRSTAQPSNTNTSNQQRSASPRQAAPTRQPVTRQAQQAQPNQKNASQPSRTASTPNRSTASASPRIARSSPSTAAPRRNELAEALAGLNSVADEAQLDATAAANSLGDIATPEPGEEESMPSYLTKPRAAARTASRTAPTPSKRTVPADEAISEEIASAAAQAVDRYAAAAAESTPRTQPQSAAARPRAAAAASARTRSSEQQQAKAAAPVVVEPAIEPVAEKLGEVEAQPANAGVVAEAPAAVAKTATPAPSRTATPKTDLRPGRDVLFSSTQPVISANIEGPQRIVVGRPVEYRVVLANKGEASANELIASIAAPAGAEIVEASASNGVVERLPLEAGVGAQQFKWQLHELAAGATQTLTLQIVPRSGREMNLDVQWDHAPVGGQAKVEIQEPKLQIELSGPGDVLFGQSQRYALTLSNPGNGAAEDVTIELTPPGGDQTSVVRHKVGVLSPGQSKKIELELTAREAGELSILAVATATGQLRSEANKVVLCRKPELQIDWRGPEKKYAGAVATYYLRVRNPGTAPADKVAVEIDLPPGAELVEASEGHSWDEARRAITWQAAGLEAGQERFMQVQCRMSQPGVNEMKLSAQTAKGDLSDVKTVPVTIEALADLKLEVSDPKGVIPVGEMAVYEIRIQNRGMTAAQGVNVVAMFSEGIDPSHVEGAQHTIRDGRVTFRPIESVPAGGDLTLRIHAKATASGTHVFRAEVSCEALDVKLAAEETTRFFTDEERLADASSAYAEEANATTR